MSVTNRSTERRPIWTEPEGADYWMLPGQTFEIVAESDDPDGIFELVEDGADIRIKRYGVSIGIPFRHSSWVRSSTSSGVMSGNLDNGSEQGAAPNL